jgi:hypothetical protein
MGESNYDRVVALWLDDHAFRENLRRDALNAVADAGIELTEEEKQALSSFDFSKFTNEQLEARILGTDAKTATSEQDLTEEQLAAVAGGNVARNLLVQAPHILAPIPTPRFTKV